MRFVCETCQTRYVIPDERTRGRVLKVRCKKCGNIIILKPEANGKAAEKAAGKSEREIVVADGFGDDSGETEQTQMVDPESLRRLREASSSEGGGKGAGEGDADSGPVVAKPPEESAEWHVILKGKQLGPFAMNALIEKMLKGEMTPRSYVWRDGMGDWKRAEEVQDVARWLPAAPEPTPPPRAVPKSAHSRAPAPRKATTGSTKAARSRGGAALATAAATNSREEAAADRFFEGGEPSDELAFVPAPSVDPFASVQDAPGLTQPKPGEVTKFFITQAGVQKAKSPWRIVYAVVGGLVVVLGGIVGLSRLGVNVPLVAQMAGDRQRVFDGKSGDSKIRDLLYGRPKPPPAPKLAGPSSGPGPVAPPHPTYTGPVEQGSLARKEQQHVDKLDKADLKQLQGMYAKEPLATIALKPSASPVIDRPDAPLTPEQVSATIARFQGSYNGCIEKELKRNPNFHGGKIRIVTTIMSSGLVRQAKIESDDARLARTVEQGDLGGCLLTQTRRMVFPSFSGEPFDAEIPLLLGSSGF